MFPAMSRKINLMKFAFFITVVHLCSGLRFECRTDETCKSVRDCARSRTDYQTRIFVMCSNDNQQVKICCPPPNNVSPVMPQLHRNFHLLSPFCGITSESERVIDGTKAYIGQFPWIALLKFQDYRLGDDLIPYTGAIINRRYILTAAHCLDEHDLGLKSVLLGELDRSTNPDCEEICADPVLEIGVEKIMFHRGFERPSLRNDIGLIRVKSDIPFTDYIQPICLPFQKAVPAGTSVKYVVAGWSTKDYRDVAASYVLQFARVEITPTLECNDYQDHAYHRFTNATHTCAGGVDVDACEMNCGAPLMKIFSDETPTQIVGIASHRSLNGCGATPSVFTKVEGYLEWILDNMRP